MARIDINNLDSVMEEFAGGGAGFFGLKNDKDTAQVRFLHSTKESLDVVIVHQVEIQGKKRWVSCLGDSCPLCLSGNQQVLKIFLQLEDLRDGKRKIWERGKTFIPTIMGLFSRFGNLDNRVYEIERQGKAGDTATKYALYPLDRDDKEPTMEKEEIIGKDKFVLEFTHDEMEALLAGAAPVPVRREQPQNPSRDTDPTSMF